MSTMMNPGSDEPTERRASQRRSYSTPVRVHVRGPDWTDSFLLHSCDVSEAGMFLHSDWLFPRGERLDLEFDLDGDGPHIRSDACVVRIAARDGRPGAGMAVNLVGLSAEQREALARLALC
jgi:hypothetical protein